MKDVGNDRKGSLIEKWLSAIPKKMISGFQENHNLTILVTLHEKVREP